MSASSSKSVADKTIEKTSHTTTCCSYKVNSAAVRDKLYIKCYLCFATICTKCLLEHRKVHETPCCHRVKKQYQPIQCRKCHAIFCTYCIKGHVRQDKWCPKCSKTICSTKWSEHEAGHSVKAVVTFTAEVPTTTRQIIWRTIPTERVDENGNTIFKRIKITEK